MPELPLKTVAFLFTDLEGSTRLWRAYPDRMPAAYTRHDAILREAVATNGGAVYKTIGDAIQAVFPSIDQAVAAAAEAQRALVKSLWPIPEPIRVRMALHVGDVEPDASGDYRSPVLNRLGRLLDAAHGGQVLLSASAAQLVDPAALPPGAALRDLGRHRLKDLGRPEPLLQLVAPGLPVVFPRPRTAPSPWTGIGASLALALAFLLFSPLATGAADFEPALFNPGSIVENLTGMVIALAAVRERALLMFTLAVIAATCVVVSLWWRGGRLSPGALGGLVSLVGRRVGLRTVGFALGLAVLFAGTFAYQQYLWRIALPIPEAQLGVALTREAAAASFDDELAFALREGTGDVVVRELPVGFDASDIDEARRLGRRIGADVVLIYREDASDSDARYVAYVVFTDPRLAWIVGNTSGRQGEETFSAKIDARPDVPVVRVGDVAGVFAELVVTAAGIVAYHDNNYAQAIALLERARASSPDGRNAGLIDAYLGDAYNAIASSRAAVTAYERGIERFERILAAGGRPSSQDLLLVASVVLARGRIATANGDFDAAIAWYERGTDLYRSIDDFGGGTVQPEDLRLAFAQIFAVLADAYRFKEKPELELRWRSRAEEELGAAELMAVDAGATRFAVARATTRLDLGDCVGAATIVQQALVRDQSSVVAHYLAFQIYRQQEQRHLASAQLRQLISARPDDVQPRLLLAAYLLEQHEPDWTWHVAGIDEAETQLRYVIAHQPNHAQARWELARTLYIKAVLRGAAVWPGEAYGDPIADAREQLTGRTTPEQQRTLLADLGAAIEQGVVATELDPEETWPHLGLLRSYQERRRVSAALLGIDPLIAADWRGLWREPTGDELSQGSVPTGSRPALLTPESQEDLDRFLADNIAAMTEVNWYLAQGASVPLGHTIEAWSHKLSILGTEWRWWNVDDDEARRATIAEAYRRAIVEAQVFADSIPRQEAALFSNLPMLYFAIAGAASDLMMSEEASAAEASLWQAVQNQGIGNGRHWATRCDEMKDVYEGSDRWRVDLSDAAKEYKAALDINPDHVWAAFYLSYVSFELGDLASARTWGAKAAVSDPIAPVNAGAWLRLGLYHAAAGDTAARDAALAHYFQVNAAYPVWTWAIELDIGAIYELQTIVARQSDDVELARAALSRIIELLLPIAERAEGVDAAWCADLLEYLGVITIAAGDPVAGESALRQSLALEPRQPEVRAMLALAVLLQGRDATTEIDAAVAEAFDPFWLPGSRDVVSPSALIRAMSGEVEHTLVVLGDDAGLAAPLTGALHAAAERSEESSGQASAGAE